MNKRSVFLDSARGFAIVLMLVFHMIVDLRDFYGFAINYNQGIWQVVNFVGVFLFIVICGWAIGANLNKNPIKHGLRILGAAMLITVATYFFDSSRYICFGILHFLACALFLAPIVQKLNSFYLLIGVIVSKFVGDFFRSKIVSTSLLIPFGLVPSGFSSFDYYPLFPWLWVYFLGILLGRYFGIEKKQSGFLPLKGLAVLGRNSLMIYLLHQPIFLLCLKILLG